MHRQHETRSGGGPDERPSWDDTRRRPSFRGREALPDDRYGGGDRGRDDDGRYRADDRYTGGDRGRDDRYGSPAGYRHDDRYRADSDRYRDDTDRYRDDRYRADNDRYRDDDRYRADSDRYRDDDRYRADSDRYRDDDRGFQGSEIDLDRQRGGGPRYHGAGWGRADREIDARHGDHEVAPHIGHERRFAQGRNHPDIDRQNRRYGEDPMDNGEHRRYLGGWDRDDDRAGSGRGMGGDTYGGQDRGHDSLIVPASDERGRYDAGRYDMPDTRRGDDRWIRHPGDDRRPDPGPGYGGQSAGMRHRR